MAYHATTIPWIRPCSHAPYFETEHGDAWLPIGHNDAIAWPTLSAPREHVDAYFRGLQLRGVTCLRVMLEYAHGDGHCFEQPVGTFNPCVVRIWDQIFELAERHEVRLLLTPFDTFWMWKRWDQHPYNAQNGGPCATRRVLLTSLAARRAMQARFAFATDRWGHSGALFAWDLWNEIHPAYAEDDASFLSDFVTEMACFVRQREHARFGRAHPLTVSGFGPMLSGAFQSPELGDSAPDPRVARVVFEHPCLDFVTVHTYAHGTIDDPVNTVDAAIAMGDLTRAALANVQAARPYFDSEHGPIHTFKDRADVLPEPFDDEYFRHVQWAHLASGGAGGGMRWPNRHPHQLTSGMHRAQHALAAFLPLIEWGTFRRRNLSTELKGLPPHVVAFACADDRQAIMWLLNRSALGPDGRLADGLPRDVRIGVPGLAAGEYEVIAFDTERGRVTQRSLARSLFGLLTCDVFLRKDVAIAIRSCDVRRSCTSEAELGCPIPWQP